jgi:hypothetical protein
MKQIAVIVFACLAAAGCAKISYVNDIYGAQPKVSVKYPDDSSLDPAYDIWDRPDMGRMMIIQPASIAAGGNIIKGATFGAVDASHPNQTFYDVAGVVFAKQGRNCKAVAAEKISNAIREVRYECDS